MKMAGDWDVQMGQWTEDARAERAAVGCEEDDRAARCDADNQRWLDSPEDWPKPKPTHTSGWEAEQPRPPERWPDDGKTYHEKEVRS